MTLQMTPPVLNYVRSGNVFIKEGTGAKMRINEKIKSLRKQKDMTLEDVAKKVGVSRQTIQRYESGVISNIPYDSIMGLAKAFNVHPGVLMGWDAAEEQLEDAPDLEKLRMGKDYYEHVTGPRKKDAAFMHYLRALYDIVERRAEEDDDYIHALKDDEDYIIPESDYYDLQDMIEDLIYSTIARKAKMNAIRKGAKDGKS